MALKENSSICKPYIVQYHTANQQFQDADGSIGSIDLQQSIAMNRLKADPGYEDRSQSLNPYVGDFQHSLTFLVKPFHSLMKVPGGHRGTENEGKQEKDNDSQYQETYNLPALTFGVQQDI
jgi:hypothetical protein